MEFPKCEMDTVAMGGNACENGDQTGRRHEFRALLILYPRFNISSVIHDSAMFSELVSNGTRMRFESKSATQSFVQSGF